MEREIRAVEVSDIPDVARLLEELGYGSTPEDVVSRFRPLMESRHDRLLVLTENGEAKAFAALHAIPLVHRSTCLVRVTAFVVSADARRRGRGSRLLAECERIASEMGAERIELTSGAARSDAHAFYVAQGYRQEGLRFSKWINEKV